MLALERCFTVKPQRKFLKRWCRKLQRAYKDDSVSSGLMSEPSTLTEHAEDTVFYRQYFETIYCLLWPVSCAATSIPFASTILLLLYLGAERWSRARKAAIQAEINARPISYQQYVVKCATRSLWFKIPGLTGVGLLFQSTPISFFCVGLAVLSIADVMYQSAKLGDLLEKTDLNA